MISLWILVILTLLAVGIGHRVSMALYLSRYQRDKLKALYLAKAGINRAILEIINDETTDYDSLQDNWSDNERVFRKIMFNDNENEFATVSYTLKEGEETKFGVTDEERKININTASKELFIALLEKCNIEAIQDKVNNILIWRGDIPDDNKIYENLGYPCKASKFTNIEELRLVKDITFEDYENLRGLITVYGDGLININSASDEALAILTYGIAKDLSIKEEFADSVANKIIELKNSNGYFRAKSDINITLTGDEETNIFNHLMDKVMVQSNNFLIEVTGNVSKIKSKTVAIYSRRDKRILYWHEG